MKEEPGEVLTKEGEVIEEEEKEGEVIDGEVIEVAVVEASTKLLMELINHLAIIRATSLKIKKAIDQIEDL